MTKWKSFVPALTILAVASPLLAGEGGAEPEKAVLKDVDALWMCLAAFLVFFMQAGFALLESGLTRAKNACNIIMKNLMDFSLGTLCFWMVGFGLMFGVSNGLFGTTDFFFEADKATSDGGFNWGFLIFQTVFCATAATIVSGAMAERTKFIGYLAYTIPITVIVYPVFGSWAWGGLFHGGGWLEAPEGGLLANLGLPGFIDFAGSTVVHSVGGWAALAGAIVLGPRLGRYGKDGKVHPIPGHSIPLAALGVFILWLGWFGFNPGSTTAIGKGEFAWIAVNTNLSAAAGAVSAMVCSWLLFKKPDTTFTMNGALAGLVAITAGCYNLSAPWAVVTGLVAGGVVVGSVLLFDKMRVDDPVGAISVHGVCGAWGTLAAGLFSAWSLPQVATQLIGISAAFVWTFSVSLGIFFVIKHTVGLRVSAQEELEGLDFSEHGMEAYPGFAMQVGREPTSTGTIAAETIARVSRERREPVGAGR